VRIKLFCPVRLTGLEERDKVQEQIRSIREMAGAGPGRGRIVVITGADAITSEARL
jgi:hypothetical protein